MPSATARLVLAGMLAAFGSCGAALCAEAHDQHARKGEEQATTGPSANYAFALPTPGTYSLPPIKSAAGESVLDEGGQPHDLSDFLHQRITVLAFMYTLRGDACPTAALQMSLLQDMAAKDKQLAGRMHLVSMSFDPDHDTPAVMAEYALDWRSAEADAPPWHFLTAPDRIALAPVLAAYDQAVDVNPEPGVVGGALHHIFRAFLIDPAGRIRNVYSLDFLDPKLVLNDIRTVLIELETADRHVPEER